MTQAITQAAALEALGITAEQLTIAKSITKEQLKTIQYALDKTPMQTTDRKWMRLVTKASDSLDFLDTMP